MWTFGSRPLRGIVKKTHQDTECFDRLTLIDHCWMASSIQNLVHNFHFSICNGHFYHNHSHEAYYDRQLKIVWFSFFLMWSPFIASGWLWPRGFLRPSWLRHDSFMLVNAPFSYRSWVWFLLWWSKMDHC